MTNDPDITSVSRRIPRNGFVYAYELPGTRQQTPGDCGASLAVQAVYYYAGYRY